MGAADITGGNVQHAVTARRAGVAVVATLVALAPAILVLPAHAAGEIASAADVPDGVVTFGWAAAGVVLALACLALVAGPRRRRDP